MWAYLTSKFVECLDRNKRLKIYEREKLRIAQKKTKMKEKTTSESVKNVEVSIQRISLLTLLTET